MQDEIMYCFVAIAAAGTTLALACARLSSRPTVKPLERVPLSLSNVGLHPRALGILSVLSVLLLAAAAFNEGPLSSFYSLCAVAPGIM